MCCANCYLDNMQIQQRHELAGEAFCALWCDVNGSNVWQWRLIELLHKIRRLDDLEWRHVRFYRDQQPREEKTHQFSQILPHHLWCF